MSPTPTANQTAGGGAARAIAVLGGLVSVALTYYAGRRNPSAVLVLLFCGWSLTPFAAAVWAAPRLRPAVVALMAVANAAIYAVEIFGGLPAKMGFIFLVVPLLSWGLLAIAALLGRGGNS